MLCRALPETIIVFHHLTPKSKFCPTRCSQLEALRSLAMGQSASNPAREPGQRLPSEILLDETHTTAVRHWSKAHVQAWLRHCELDFCVDAFARLAVNGAALKEITDEDLRVDFRISESFQRRRLLSCIAELLNREGGGVVTADALQKSKNQRLGSVILLVFCVCVWKLLSRIFS